ncbi:MAG: ATP-dependent DNA helicase UvrD2 [Actinomycetota bacterium]
MDISSPAAFPGPSWLGRGIVISPGDPLPPEAEAWPLLVLDDDALSQPLAVLDRLDVWWRQRVASVVVLEVPFAALRAPEASDAAPHALDAGFEFSRERVHFLTWANRYDGRNGQLRWHHGEKALATGAAVCRDGSGDVVVDDEPTWVDGGPRRSWDPDPGLIHVESVWAGLLRRDRSRSSAASLAPDQQAAVSDPGGPARVIAPAGSGKTRVLTERMRHLLVDREWNPDSVTALAYNRRAAEEMRSRLQFPQAHVRTLHAWGYEILGRARGGRPELLGEREVRRILGRLLSLRPRANEDPYAPYIEALSEVRAGLRPPQEVEAERDDVGGLSGLFDVFRQELSRRRAIDHDEQIYGAVEALLRDPELRRWAQSRCRHLLVDEFQDLTPAHLLMIRLLSAPAYDVFGVGDDDQVIYGYAGASPEFLIDYTRYFPGASHHQLEVNYRCPAPVVEASLSLLGHNRHRIDKQVRPRSSVTTGLEVMRATERHLGDRLVSLVEGLLERDGPASVAVLARVNVGLLVPQISLARAGVPADTVLDESLLHRSGVATALAWLRLARAVAAGEPMQGSDFEQATRRPPRGLSPGIRSALGRGTWTLDRLDSFAAGSTEPRSRSRLESLVDDIGRLSARVADGESVARQLEYVRDELGLASSLDRLDNSRARPTGGHTDDLDALIMLAHTHPDVEVFEPWLRAALGEARSGDPRVTLSTIHRVKGLEWPHVVVWDASNGLMPHRLADDVEEERRIFHVAVTRCSESVTVLSRSGNGSPFVRELEGEAPPPPVRSTAGPERRAEVGLEMRWQGFSAVVTALEDEAAVVRVGAASRMRVPWGDPVVVDGRRMRLSPPAAPAADPDVLDALRDWRKGRAAADGVPPYVVAHDRHLVSIAARRPRTLEDLGNCEGIGPARLERYGPEILAVVGDHG